MVEHVLLYSSKITPTRVLGLSEKVGATLAERNGLHFTRLDLNFPTSIGIQLFTSGSQEVTLCMELLL